MFLSLCILKNSKPIDYYQLHKELWKYFPNFDSSSYPISPFFYRIENPYEKGNKKILMQSVIEPVQNENLKLLELKQTKNLSHSFKDLKPHQELKFFIRAYPSKRLKKEGKKTNREKVRVPLRKDIQNNLTKDQVTLQWLKKIIERENHISVKNCQIVESFPLRFRKKQNGKYHFGTIYTVSFKGYLKLNRPKEFVENIVYYGIGPGKAFGCGMLSIAKA